MLPVASSGRECIADRAHRFCRIARAAFDQMGDCPLGHQRIEAQRRPDPFSFGLGARFRPLRGRVIPSATAPSRTRAASRACSIVRPPNTKRLADVAPRRRVRPLHDERPGSRYAQTAAGSVEYQAVALPVGERCSFRKRSVNSASLLHVGFADLTRTRQRGPYWVRMAISGEA